jgi:hypothetical protein
MALSQEEEMLLHELVYGSEASNEEDKEKHYDQTKELLEKYANNESSQLDGALDMIKLTLSVGSPVPSILFTEIINSCDISDHKKSYYNSKIRDSMPKDVGCIQIGRFVDVMGQSRSGFIVYKECDDSHHIEDEIRDFVRLYTHDKNIRKKIKESIYTQLHQFSRTGYMSYLHLKDQNTEIFTALETKYPADFDHNKLEYSPSKGQFSLSLPGTKKVGIFIETTPE